MTTLEPLLTPEQAMAILGCRRRFLTQHRAALGGVKVGRSLRFTGAGLAAYVERQRIAETQVPVPVPAPKPTVRLVGSGRLDPVTLRPLAAGGSRAADTRKRRSAVTKRR